MKYTYSVLKNCNNDLSLIQLLKFLGDLKSSRMRPANIATGDELDLPPMLIWSYKNETKESIAFITNVINTYKWKHDWILRSNNKKWCLSPKRVLDIQLSHKLNNFDEALAWLRNNDPKFGRECNEDLKVFTKYFRDRIEEYLKELES